LNGPSGMENYDVAIIGAGMSGLAAGIRLAHFGKRVCIFERHNAPGGLNSFYFKDGRKYDVGLHAMTNFAEPSIKRAPLNRILRQLRISRDDLQLRPHKRSRIASEACDLTFANDIEHLIEEVGSVFPSQKDGFIALYERIRDFDDEKLNGPYVSARDCVRSFINDPLLEDMLFCPVMYYGSSTEGDMDWGQFIIMFRALFIEGLARPREGIRVMMKVLLERYREAGGIRRMRTGVKRIEVEGTTAKRLVLDSGEIVQAERILSSAGLLETSELCSESFDVGEEEGNRLGFCETISGFDQGLDEIGWDEDAIVFFFARNRFLYEKPTEAVDLRSGVICMPGNFQYEEPLNEGLVRVTALADQDRWFALTDEDYAAEKAHWEKRIWESATRFLPSPKCELSRSTFDMFTPKTVQRFTWHKEGAIYGSSLKRKDGRTPVENIFLCGTDQGFLGIVGALLSGVAIANEHALR